MVIHILLQTNTSNKTPAFLPRPRASGPSVPHYPALWKQMTVFSCPSPAPDSRPEQGTNPSQSSRFPPPFPHWQTDVSGAGQGDMFSVPFHGMSAGAWQGAELPPPPVSGETARSSEEQSKCSPRLPHPTPTPTSEGLSFLDYNTKVRDEVISYVSPHKITSERETLHYYCLDGSREARNHSNSSLSK